MPSRAAVAPSGLLENVQVNARLSWRMVVVHYLRMPRQLCAGVQRLCGDMELVPQPGLPPEGHRHGGALTRGASPHEHL